MIPSSKIFFYAIFIFFCDITWAQELNYLFSSEGILLNPATRIVVLGDLEHGEKGTIQNSKTILAAVRTRDPDYNCYFVEVSSEFNQSIQDFTKNKKSYHDSITSQVKQFTAGTVLRFQNIIPDHLLTHANELNYLIYGVDFKKDSSFGDQLLNWLTRQRAVPKEMSFQEEHDGHIRLLVEARNKIMAENIWRHLSSGECKKGIYLVGNAHMRNEVRGEKVVSIQGYLETKKIKSESYFIRPYEEFKR